MLYFRRRVDDVHKIIVLISRIGLFLALPSSPTLIMPLFFAMTKSAEILQHDDEQNLNPILYDAITPIEL